MSLPASIILDRPARMPLDRSATLRHGSNTATANDPIDVRVDDLSTGGCQVTSATPLPLDTVVTIGIAGMGRRTARIVRDDAPLYGLAFLEPADTDEVMAARTAETVVAGPFADVGRLAAARQHGWTTPDDEQNIARFSPRARFMLILGAGAALWALVGAALAVVALR